MWFDSAVRPPGETGPLGRADAQLKILVALAFVIAVVVTPATWIGALAIEAGVLLLVILISRVPLIWLIKRWLGFLLLFGSAAALAALAHPDRRQLGFWPLAFVLIARSSLAFLAFLIVPATTSFPQILSALRHMGMPAVVVATMQVMYRYLFVMEDELRRMKLARRARTFRRSGRLDWRALSGLIGVLFARSLERGERVHAAMRARGWSGDVPALE